MVAGAMPIDPLIGVDHARAVSRRVNWSVDKTKFGPHKGGLCKFILLLISEEWDGTSLFHFPLLGNYKIQVLGTHKYIKCTSTKATLGGEAKHKICHCTEWRKGQTQREHTHCSLCVCPTQINSLYRYKQWDTLIWEEFAAGSDSGSESRESRIRKHLVHCVQCSQCTYVIWTQWCQSMSLQLWVSHFHTSKHRGKLS